MGFRAFLRSPCLSIVSKPWFLPRAVVVLAGLAAVLVLIGPVSAPGQTDSDVPPSGRPSDASRQALSLLIQTFLETEDSERAGRLLSDILRDPAADLETVTAMIRAGRPAQAEPVGLQPNMPVQSRGKSYRYGLSVPRSYSPSRDYALVICLHGAGFTGDAYLERWQPRLGDDAILACPTYPSGMWWTREAEDLVLATLRAVQARYRVDPDRIFLTGMSNGGIGAYLIGFHHATRFAGLAPMASGIDDVLFPFLANLRNTPVYLIHGAQDQVMPVSLSRSIAQELTRLGYAFVYREHDRVHPMAGGHFFPREELPALAAWMGTHRREPYPKHLTVVRDATHLLPFGWVRIDATDRIASFTERLTDNRDETILNRVYATLDAEIVSPNRIEVHTQRVRRYTLFLNQELADLSQPITILTDGRLSYQSRVTPSPETLLREARLRRDRHQLFPILLTLTVEAAP